MKKHLISIFMIIFFIFIDFNVHTFFLIIVGHWVIWFHIQPSFIQNNHTLKLICFKEIVSKKIRMQFGEKNIKIFGIILILLERRTL